MDDLQSQIKLLNSVNKKLMKDVKMLHLICETSTSAFLYYNYEEKTIRTIANWDYFFDFSVESMEDFSKFYGCVEEKYAVPLREALFIEKKRHGVHDNRRQNARRQNVGRSGNYDRL